ncbi:hypothetical protein B0T26DRAFT_780082 [Lasiosphaeria miniovina]|uniref:T6SS Phospholipase effector Tle1-like catalytic domain-containing protein n=1 Tax=Lasiosphaeria miniovina TaxID=1954250 RepID=A0AA40ABA3_9PEZI|nr:uncharacterized protein B0T26DRAFT_780082 [Lasiosphaeria miniovina]KAK0712629.1 hypothetical protein B0T26DRAFT_780082 [Lasiosphaeria miniovina]
MTEAHPHFIGTYLVASNNEHALADDCHTLTDKDHPRKTDVHRRLIFICDGTSNNPIKDAGVDTTNPGRMASMFLSRSDGPQPAVPNNVVQNKHDNSKVWEQIIVIQPGLGNDGRGHKHLDLASARHIVPIVVSLVRAASLFNLKVGDAISLIGFSRGSTTALILMAIFARWGPLDMDKFRAIHQEPYKRDGVKGDVLDTAITEMVQKFIICKGSGAIPAPFDGFIVKNIKIDFVGVYDPVASLGFPDVGGLDSQKHTLDFVLDLDGLSTIGQVAVAVSDSEHRESFKPFLPHKSAAATNANTTKLSITVFPGYHTSIGGGAGIHDPVQSLTLVWMTGHAIDAGLQINENALIDMALPAYGFTPKHMLNDSKKGFFKAGGDFHRLEFGPVAKWHPSMKQPRFTELTHVNELPKETTDKKDNKGHETWLSNPANEDHLSTLEVKFNAEREGFLNTRLAHLKSHLAEIGLYDYLRHDENGIKVRTVKQDGAALHAWWKELGDHPIAKILKWGVTFNEEEYNATKANVMEDIKASEVREQAYLDADISKEHYDSIWQHAVGASLQELLKLAHRGIPINRVPRRLPMA